MIITLNIVGVEGTDDASEEGDSADNSSDTDSDIGDIFAYLLE